MKYFIYSSLLLVIPIQIQARPILTREVETIGNHNFEAGTFYSKRTDKFGSPNSTYDTQNFSAFARVGIFSNTDLGFSIRRLSHNLTTGDHENSGVSRGELIPEIKISPSEFWGLYFAWETTSPSQPGNEIPIKHGNNIEGMALFKIPTRWPIYFNTGILWKDSYHSDDGIEGAPQRKYEPSAIFENRLSLEIPFRFNLGLLGELAYYRFGENVINGQSLSSTSGEAMDALAGLTWTYRGWNIAGGVGFGLLEEHTTSFDLTRGQGDYTYQINIAYKLAPRKEEP